MAGAEHAQEEGGLVMTHDQILDLGQRRAITGLHSRPVAPPLGGAS